MSIYNVIDKCPIPVGAHLVKGHVKEGNIAYVATKSYFTDENGTAIAWMPAVNLLSKAKDTVTSLASKNRDQAKTLTNGTATVYAIKADEGKLGFAVTWGKRVGTDSGGTECKWVCMFVTKTLTSSRHQWVTAYPALETYVTGKKL